MYTIPSCTIQVLLLYGEHKCSVGNLSLFLPMHYDLAQQLSIQVKDISSKSTPVKIGDFSTT